MAKSKEFELPLPPWSLEDSNDEEPGLISRYGPEKAEEIYCRLATEFGFFNPKAEATNYRPPLDCTPFLDRIRAQHKSKSIEGSK